MRNKNLKLKILRYLKSFNFSESTFRRKLNFKLILFIPLNNNVLI
jgi:hypothetical protein